MAFKMRKQVRYLQIDQWQVLAVLADLSLLNMGQYLLNVFFVNDIALLMTAWCGCAALCFAFYEWKKITPGMMIFARKRTEEKPGLERYLILWTSINAEIHLLFIYLLSNIYGISYKNSIILAMIPFLIGGGLNIGSKIFTYDDPTDDPTIYFFKKNRHIMGIILIIGWGCFFGIHHTKSSITILPPIENIVEQ